MSRIEYKNSGIFWQPFIPKSWHVTRLKYILKKLSREKGADDELLVCSNSGDIKKRGDSRLGLVANSNDIYQGVRSGDLLIHGMDTWHGAIAVSKFDGMCTPVVHVCDSSQNKEYVATYLRNMASQQIFKLISNGVRQNTSDFRSWDKLSRIPIPLPPLAEQEKIVSYLEDKTSKIDEVILAKREQIKLLQELKDAEIANVIIKGLDPNAKMKKCKNSLLGLIPMHWHERKLKYCFRERTEKNHPNEPVLCATQSQGVIPQSIYQNRVVMVNKSFEELKFVKIGDFVISLRSFEGGIEYAYYQGIISAAYTVLVLNKIENTDYFRLLFKSQPFIQVLQTCVTGIREGQNINYQMLSREFIPIPPVKEQRSIVSYIEDKCNQICALISDLEAEIAYLKEYKQKLISDCVTGQINVQREQ